MKRMTLKAIASLYMACLALCLTMQSCIREEEAYKDDSPSGNLEALWTLMNEKYCFFDCKGVDWDSVHTAYSRRITPSISQWQLFEVMCSMLTELRDGHVNLSCAADLGRYWSWYEDFPDNFDTELQKKYLGTDYKIAAGLRYRILDDNVGYVTVNDFSTGFGAGNLDEVMYHLRLCCGIIIDVRNNSGGQLDYAEALAERFTNEERHVGYIKHKTGTGHNDFSNPEPEYIKPGKGIRWQKPVVVLTNRRCYSATNTFVRDMKCMPLATIMGDRTGGGSGMPFNGELPNGWSVRFSAVPMFDKDMKHIEFGIEPDIYCQLDTVAAQHGIDSMIEKARERLRLRSL